MPIWLTSYPILLFDADGTLFDYEAAERFALETAFSDLGLPFQPDYRQLYQRINKQIWLDFEQGRISAARLRARRFELLFEQAGLAADAEAFSARYLLRLAEGAQLSPGALETVRRLHQDHYRLAIITNGLKDVQRPRLERSSIRPFIDVLIISEEVGAVKPDPAYFDAAFHLLGEPDKSQVLVIGDSLSSDIQGGLRYGLDTCWYNPARLPPDPAIRPKYEIQRLADLLNGIG